MMNGEPYLSARRPVKGCEMPQMRFCKAIAKANVSIPHSNSVLTGFKNKPNPCLIPNENRRIVAPQTKAMSAAPHLDDGWLCSKLICSVLTLVTPFIQIQPM